MGKLASFRKQMPLKWWVHFLGPACRTLPLLWESNLRSMERLGGETLNGLTLLSVTLHSPLLLFGSGLLSPLISPTGLSVGPREDEKLGLGVMLMTNTEVASTQLGKVNKMRKLKKTEHERQLSKSVSHRPTQECRRWFVNEWKGHIFRITAWHKLALMWKRRTQVQ